MSVPSRPSARASRNGLFTALLVVLMVSMGAPAIARTTHPAGLGPQVGPVPSRAPSAPPVPLKLPGGPGGSGSASASVSWTPLAGSTGQWVFAFGEPGTANSYMAAVTAVCATCSTATVPGLQAGHTVNLKVYGTNGSGNVLLADTGTLTMAGKLPAAPGLVWLTPGSGSVVVRWVTPHPDGGPLTSFDVELDNASNGSVLTQATSCPGCTSQSLTLANGTAAVAKVRAHNLTGVGPWSSSRAATPSAPPAAPTNTNAIVSGADAVVSWASPTPLDNTLVQAFTASGYFDQRTSCSGCTSLQFDALPVNEAITFAIWPRRNGSFGPAAAAGPVTIPSALCPSVGVCLAADPSLASGPEAHSASGFLLGLAPTLNPSLVTALKPQQWRIGAADPTDSQQAASLGATKQTFLVSGAWYQATYTAARGAALPPWSDWDLYEAWLRATVQASLSQSVHPEYWEVVNEPETLGQPENTLELIRRAAAVIRSVDPQAKIAGPTICGGRWVGGPQPLDITSTLDFLVTTGTHLDALTIHEIGGCAGMMDTPIASAGHVKIDQTLITDRPGLGNPAVVVNEYGDASTRMLPGATVGYIAALDTAGAAEANRSCWPVGATDECSNGSLDGLFTAGGAIPLAPYWVYLAYAGMTGERIHLQTTSDSASGLATWNAAGQTLEILAGRHESCVSASNQYCGWWPIATTPPPVNTTFALRWPGTATSVTVTVQRITATNGPVATAPASTTLTLPVTAGVVQVPIAGFADGEAVHVTVTAG